MGCCDLGSLSLCCENIVNPVNVFILNVRLQLWVCVKLQKSNPFIYLKKKKTIIILCNNQIKVLTRVASGASEAKLCVLQRGNTISKLKS